MHKWKIILFNQETFEIVDDCIDDELFDTREEAEEYRDSIYENLPEGLESLSLRGEKESGAKYGYGNNDLVLNVVEDDW